MSTWCGIDRKGSVVQLVRRHPWRRLSHSWAVALLFIALGLGIGSIARAAEPEAGWRASKRRLLLQAWHGTQGRLIDKLLGAHSRYGNHELEHIERKRSRHTADLQTLTAAWPILENTLDPKQLAAASRLVAFAELKHDQEVANCDVAIKTFTDAQPRLRRSDQLLRALKVIHTLAEGFDGTTGYLRYVSDHGGSLNESIRPERLAPVALAKAYREATDPPPATSAAPSPRQPTLMEVAWWIGAQSGTSQDQADWRKTIVPKVRTLLEDGRDLLVSTLGDVPRDIQRLLAGEDPLSSWIDSATLDQQINQAHADKLNPNQLSSAELTFWDVLRAIQTTFGYERARDANRFLQRASLVADQTRTDTLVENAWKEHSSYSVIEGFAIKRPENHRQLSALLLQIGQADLPPHLNKARNGLEPLFELLRPVAELGRLSSEIEITGRFY